MSTAVGVTTFVLGRDQDKNLETRTYKDGQTYDLSVSLIQAYTANDATFPYPA